MAYTPEQEQISNLQAALAAALTSGSVVSKTWADLNDMKWASQLVPGQWYLLTDFAQRWYDWNISPAAYQSSATEPLYIRAASNRYFSREAFSSLYPQDVLYYDFDAFVDERPTHSFSSSLSSSIVIGDIVQIVYPGSPVSSPVNFVGLGAPSNARGTLFKATNTTVNGNGSVYIKRLFDTTAWKGSVYRRIDNARNIDVCWNWRYITFATYALNLSAVCAPWSSSRTYGTLPFSSGDTLLVDGASYISSRNQQLFFAHPSTLLSATAADSDSPNWSPTPVYGSLSLCIPRAGLVFNGVTIPTTGSVIRKLLFPDDTVAIKNVTIQDSYAIVQNNHSPFSDLYYVGLSSLSITASTYVNFGTATGVIKNVAKAVFGDFSGEAIYCTDTVVGSTINSRIGDSRYQSSTVLIEKLNQSRLSGKVFGGIVNDTDLNCTSGFSYLGRVCDNVKIASPVANLVLYCRSANLSLATVSNLYMAQNSTFSVASLPRTSSATFSGSIGGNFFLTSISLNNKFGTTGSTLRIPMLSAVSGTAPTKILFYTSARVNTSGLTTYLTPGSIHNVTFTSSPNYMVFPDIPRGGLPGDPEIAHAGLLYAVAINNVSSFPSKKDVTIVESEDGKLWARYIDNSGSITTEQVSP